MKISLISLGCHKNQVDSENILGILDTDHNIEISDSVESSDVLIINTCGFIQDAKEEAINTIISAGEYKKKGIVSKIIVAGCLGQRYPEKLMEEMPEIDAIIGTGEISKIEEILENLFKNDKNIKTKNLDYIATSDTPRKLLTNDHTAYVKIAEGCDNRCTYCIIPDLRGNFRSRSMEDIKNEVTKLANNGTKEISIIAQDTTDYGKDIYGKRRLSELLKELSMVSGIEWIRVFYTYPDNFSEDLISTIKNNNKIINYFDVPIQHISDEILKRMNRVSSSKTIKDLIHDLKNKVPNAVLRTSLIVGFPGETEEDFKQLKDFLKKEKFDYVGIFSYSKEEGTPAYNMDGQIPEDIKQKRWQELSDIQETISNIKNQNLVGKTVDVIIDKDSEDDSFLYEGRAKRQAYDIDGKVFIESGQAVIGDIKKVEITENFGYDYVGRIV
ncbi:MAG: 30S ribosomal protein S12 methylthiotransferase RimO [Fusobacteriota bacterium]